jgi:predicted DNA-binding protein (MmcQ/YjbR family)
MVASLCSVFWRPRAPICSARSIPGAVATFAAVGLWRRTGGLLRRLCLPIAPSTCRGVRCSLRCVDIDWVRQCCLSLPNTTEQVQWRDDLVFKVGGKMFAMVPLEPRDRWLSFKCTPSEFSELVERPGIVPAPYLARAHWVSVETESALARAEIERLLREAYDSVFAKLPKMVQTRLLRCRPSRNRSDDGKR